jgi:hypothetical protein
MSSITNGTVVAEGVAAVAIAALSFYYHYYNYHHINI